MKAYITFFKEGIRIKKEMTLEEAKKTLTKKQYEKLVSFEGIHTNKISGYVA